MESTIQKVCEDCGIAIRGGIDSRGERTGVGPRGELLCNYCATDAAVEHNRR